MAQNFGAMLIGAVATGILMMIGKPIAAIYIASKARGADPERRAFILTKAFEIDHWNRKIARDLAETHMGMSRKNKQRASMHLEAAARALFYASGKWRGRPVNESLKQSIADLQENLDARLLRLR